MQLHLFRQELSFNSGVGNTPYGPVPPGNEGVRKRMHLEDHHDTPRDCMDLGGAPGSYLDYIYLDFMWIFFFF